MSTSSTQSKSVLTWSLGSHGRDLLVVAQGFEAQVQTTYSVPTQTVRPFVVSRRQNTTTELSLRLF